MTTMVEQVAEELRRYAPWLSELGAHALTRFVLKAMREPTPEMNAAMRMANMAAIGGYDGPSAWEAAIDAALSEPTPTPPAGGG